VSDCAIDFSGVRVKWTAKERELWLDLFTNFCDSIMGATLEEHSGTGDYPEKQLKSDITLSADLADHAIQEAQYRMSAKFIDHGKQRTGLRRAGIPVVKRARARR